jgi:hypothetical protein
MIQDQFNFPGLRIGLAGFAVAMAAVGLGVYAGAPDWLVFLLAAIGIGLGWLGAVFHFIDMVRQYRAEAAARREWIALHGDPDRRDDPAAPQNFP